MANETNLLKRVRQHAQTLRDALPFSATLATPQDVNLKKLLEQVFQELSTMSIGFFPGQIGPNRLIQYHDYFNQLVPGYAVRNAAKIQGAYSRETTLRVREFIDAIYSDLQNQNVYIPWLIDKVGSYLLHQPLRSWLSRFVREKADGLDRALKS